VNAFGTHTLMCRRDQFEGVATNTRMNLWTILARSAIAMRATAGGDHVDRFRNAVLLLVREELKKREHDRLVVGDRHPGCVSKPRPSSTFWPAPGYYGCGDWVRPYSGSQRSSAGSR
jgi:hypothetical protein